MLGVHVAEQARAGLHSLAKLLGKGCDLLLGEPERPEAGERQRNVHRALGICRPSVGRDLRHEAREQTPCDEPVVATQKSQTAVRHSRVSGEHVALEIVVQTDLLLLGDLHLFRELGTHVQQQAAEISGQRRERALERRSRWPWHEPLEQRERRAIEKILIGPCGEVLADERQRARGASQAAHGVFGSDGRSRRDAVRAGVAEHDARETVGVVEPPLELAEVAQIVCRRIRRARVEEGHVHLPCPHPGAELGVAVARGMALVAGAVAEDHVEERPPFVHDAADVRLPCAVERDAEQELSAVLDDRPADEVQRAELLERTSVARRLCFDALLPERKEHVQ
jgi:hypothetical protein